jgi:hypothetical protein
MKKAALDQRNPPTDRLVTSDEIGNHVLYAEYVRGFDDVPVLRDAVLMPPPKARPDFRAGARRDERKEARPDPYAVREASTAETEHLYDEYLHPIVVRPKRKKRNGRKKKKKH